MFLGNLGVNIVRKHVDQKASWALDKSFGGIWDVYGLGFQD